MAEAQGGDAMKHLATITLTASAICLIGTSAIINKQNIRLVWNTSASVPIGLYRITAKDSLAHGDLVLIRPSERLSIFLSSRQYLPAQAMLLKHIAALPGQTICRTGNMVFVDQMPIGIALQTDSIGRQLPVWQGCVSLSTTQIFVMNPDARDSFDGRYFGPLPRTAIIGHAIPLFTLPTSHP